MKRYEILCEKINTNLEWTQTIDDITKVKKIVNKFKNNYTSTLSVFDCVKKDVVYYKSAFTSTPEKDLLFNNKKN